MTTYTNNYAFVLQAFNENSGTWGTTGSGSFPANPGPGLNNGVFAPLDSILGANISIAISAGSNSISFSNWLNKIFILTGALTGNAVVILPLSPNSIGSATAVGGEFVVVNNTSGAFTVTVQTAATGSVGVLVPQSKASVSTDTYLASLLYSDGVNVRYADKGSVGFAQGVSGNPNGQIAGIAGSVNTNSQLAYDYVNGILYVCTSTGIASGGGQAVWTNPVSSGQTIPQPEGYLTVVSNTPIITGDALSQTVLYYTPFYGAWAAINGGAGIIPYKFSTQMPLVLSSSQAANQIYDIYIIYNGGTPGSGTPVIASGMAWTTATAGSCNRGSGGGTAQIGRDSVSGLYVNSQTQSMAYNNGSISGTASVPAGGGVYLGSVWMDGINGQISCYRSWGQNRKFGVWNCFNRSPIIMISGDSTTNWVYGTATWRPSNNNSANKIQSFCGLPEEQINADFRQNFTVNTNGSIGIGFNITNGPFGMVGALGNATAQSIGATGAANFIASPNLGIQNFQMIEFAPGNTTYGGTSANMQMSVTYRG